MPITRISIRDPYGLHLRLADRIAHLAERFRAEVRVLTRGREADGESILDLLGLAAAGGNRLELEAQGPDAQRAVAALADLIATWSPEDLVDEGTGSPRRPLSRPRGGPPASPPPRRQRHTPKPSVMGGLT